MSGDAKIKCRYHIGGTAFLVLNFIDRNSSTYAITIREKTKLSFGRIYADLTKLEQQGLVRSEWGNPTRERGWRRKRLFSATPDGAAYLNVFYRVRDDYIAR